MPCSSRLSVLALLVCFILCAFPSAAPAEQHLYTWFKNTPLFHYEIYDAGESYNEDDPDEISTWTLGQRDLDGIQLATDYWVAIIGPGAVNRDFITITVATDDEDNASASSQPVTSGPYIGMTELAAALLHDYTGDEPGQSMSLITIGLDPNRGPRYLGPIEVLTHNGWQEDMASTITHELGHALGMISTADYDEDFDTNFFGSTLSRWDQWLVDSFGEPSAPDMRILEDTGAAPGFFTLRPDFGYAFFLGPTVLGVLGDAMLDPYGNVEGLPINGFEGDGAELSHIELKNSLMSHQNYRNYGIFLEAELAVYQDLGYDIDLKSQFGLSIYESGNPNIVNTTGFYARNAEGTGWLPGVYNTSVGAVGLHVYGAGNTVIQAADILSAGPGSAGIRMDGYYLYNSGTESSPVWETIFGNNQVTVDQGVKVHAHGTGGTGVMVAYGQDQVLVNRGEIAALGQGGIGARFDFGSNELGDSVEYRGSYIWIDRRGDMDPDLDQEGLDGALVSRFDLTGTLAGSAAAIYISENALVEQINVMRGSRIQGDIISDWNPNDPRVQTDQILGPETTTLSFGWLADTNTGEVQNPFGNGVYIQDRDFSMRYQGNILGRQGLNVLLAGGELTWQGRMDVLEYRQENGAALIGLISDQPSVIKAGYIQIDSGARLGVAGPEGFRYGQIDGHTLPVLVFDAPSYSLQGAPIDSRGSFAMGAYDYTYANPAWLDQTTFGVEIDRRFNRQRGGASAVTAPLALAAHNPSTDALIRRGAEVFGRSRNAGPADSFLLAWAGNEAAMLRQGAGLTPPAHLEEGQRARGTRGHGSDLPEWVALANGGAERSAGQSSLWVSPGYSHASRSGGSGYEINSLGLRMGYDVWLADQAFAGLAVSLDYPEYESDDADIDARNITASLYGGVLLPLDLELGLFASLGHTRHEQKRRVPGQTFDTDYDADSYSLGAHLGRSFDLSGQAAIRPFISYDFTHVDVDGYNEGQGVYALKFNSVEYDLHRITAGTDLGWTFDNRAWLSGRIYYAGLWGDRTASTSAYFSMDPQTNGFTSRGDSLDRHSLGLGLGAGLTLNEWLDLTAGYSFLGGQNTHSHLVEAGLRLNF